MDSTVNAALEEICAKGVNGVSLSDLWDRLHLCPSVKQAVWSGLIKVPGLQFRVRGAEFDPNSKSLEQCEGLGKSLVVFANEQLRRCFVGLYDVKASSITPPQQKVLEKLAFARGNGITQDQLCKDLNIPANNFFYVVKRLESWGLVVRQSTIVRKPKEAPKRTNLIRLHRYAAPLGSQQRLEITIENNNSEENIGENVEGGDHTLEEHGQDDVLVKDFLPALKAVCDRLEQAEGKVLVVTDIKQELGYRETRGHRAWRMVCNRLEQSGLVEVFEAKVDANVATTPNNKRSKSRGKNKAVKCMRLLKKFSPKIFEKRTPEYEYDNLVSEQTAPCGNQMKNTEQLVELPLEQQIFDMIDQEGSKGLLGVEVCRRLGISNKMLDNLSNAMIPRFGFHQLSENRKRGSAYRFWTRGNFNPQLPNSSLNRLEKGPDEHGLTLSPVKEPSYCEISQGNKTDSSPPSLQKFVTGKSTATINAEQVLKDGPVEDKGPCELVVWSKDSQDKSITLPATVTATKSNSNLVVFSSPSVPKPFNLQQGQRYPSVTSTQREQRIIEMLKTEKIILKPELQRWLDSFDMEKQPKMARKTLVRCLIKLKREGHCKTMLFNIPGVSNGGRPRDVEVILHPSVEYSHGELSDKVVDRWRSFETQIRGSPSKSKKKLPVPVLHGIQRIQNKSNSDAPSVKSELMRANGFVGAKMVRTKLLHQYLWRFVNNSVQCEETSPWSKHVTSKNPHSSCLFFELDTAIKAMPLELFLQVVGSVLNLNDMTAKCKAGLRLSDFPQDEYSSLMNTRATGRLSWLIDILRRLKLIRLIVDESPKEAAKTSHTTLTYALEFKPYIEEPPSVDPLHEGSDSLDLRPHFRHDFVLSSSEAVDKYWQTLEYCYAAADQNAAIHAFPGSAVHEVCYFKSWTTIRVMTAEQRSELIKRIKDKPNKKLVFKECREIAKDLKLSLEQVLRVYYDHRQCRLSRAQGDLDVQGADSNATNDRPRQSRRKRKISSKGRSAKRVNINHTAVTAAENMEEPGVAEQEHHESLLDHCAMPMLLQPRKPKFSWSEEADRKLLTQVARRRAIQGARRGTDWSSMSDLPAPPSTCRRRMALLNMDIKFRESLIRLCNLLSKRYAQQRRREENVMNDGECGQETDTLGDCWDDFTDSKIKAAFNEVIIYKKMIKPDASKRLGSGPEGSQNLISNSQGSEKDGDQQHIECGRRSRLQCLPQKFVKHLKEGYSTARRLTQSLAVASAVELFKLVFLTNSKSTEMPSLLAETLRCYSEHDLISAFDYLREKKIMIGCGTSQPFVLSQHFLRSLSSSQFPANTGKRAARRASWLHENAKNLMETKVNLPADLQCGDVLFLFALISSGELSILPLLPDEGVGEAEDSRSSKRKYDEHEFEDYGLIKKLKCHSLQESEIFSRREKGFPGIAVALNRAMISRPNVVEFFKHEDKTVLLSENDHFYNTLGRKESCTSSTIHPVKESPDFGSIIPATVIYGESLWEVMASYTMQYLLQHSGREYTEIHPELIRTSHKTIQRAGDQGLSMSKFSEYTSIQDAVLAECVIDVLQLFGLVLKVIGYNSIHIVDGRYRTKYFLTSMATRCQDPERASSLIPQTLNNGTNIIREVGDSGHEVNFMNVDEVHKVTVLNLSEDVSQQSNLIGGHNEVEGCTQSEIVSNGGKKENQKFDISSSSLRPISPWINGDGTINEIVYRGLTRRILGIVTQHPGTLEDDIMGRMELNPQSCRQLLELMVLNKHLIVRKMNQSTSSAPPNLLKSLIGEHSKKPKFICREHYFANLMSASLL